MDGDAIRLNGESEGTRLAAPEEGERAISWIREFWEEMRQGGEGSIYLNFVSSGEDTEAMMRASYGDANYERLVEIKSKYDPTNMFQLNQNIRPRSD